MATTSRQYKYFAFISYKHEDEKWAKWLQEKLMRYRIPVTIRKENPSLPERVHPVFRDTTDLSGGMLAKAISEALEESKYLIVICSPRAAKSPWVCKEVEKFIQLGREENIIPFIVEGTPFSNDSSECFPAALKELSGEKELLGINVNENGQDSAAIKVVSRIFNISFDTLWQRFRRAQRQRIRIIATAVSAFILFLLGVTGCIWQKNVEIKTKNVELEAKNQTIARQNQQIKEESKRANAAADSIKKQKDLLQITFDKLEQSENSLRITNANLQRANIRLAEEKDNVLRSQTRAISQICNELIENGNPLLAERIMLNLLPDRAQDYNWPYVPEAEQTMRRALSVIQSPDWHQNTYLEHKLKVNNASFSANNGYILSASNDNTAVLWNLGTADTICFKHGALVNCATMSPDGRYVATGCRDYSARLWDSHTGKLLDSWDLDANVWQIYFTSDNRYILTYSSHGVLEFYDVLQKKVIGYIPFRQHLSKDIFDKTNSNFIYAFADSIVTSINIPLLANKFEEIDKVCKNQDLKGFENILEEVRTSGVSPYLHSQEINNIKYNSECNRGCILTSDSLAVYVDFNKGQDIYTAQKATDCVFSSDGQFLVIPQEGNVVTILSTEDGTNYYLYTLDTPALIQQCQFSKDDQYLIGTSSDNNVYIWDLEDNWNLSSTLKHDSYIAYVEPDAVFSKILTITSDKRVNLWDRSAGYNKIHCVYQDSYAQDIVFNSDETVFYVASYDGRVTAYDTTTGEPIWVTVTYTNIHKDLENKCIAINADNSLLAVGNDCGEVIFIDPRDGALLKRVRSHQKQINTIAFCANGKDVITSSNDKQVHLLNISSGNVLKSYDHNESVLFAHMLKDNNMLSASSKGLYLWSKDQKQYQFFPLENEGIECATINENNDMLAVGTNNNSIYFYSTTQLNQPLNVIQHGMANGGRPEKFSFDNFVRIEHDESEYDDNMKGAMEGTSMGRDFYRLLSHKEPIRGLQFCKDGKYLVSSSESSVKIWETNSGLCLKDDINAGIGFRCFALSPNLSYVATSSMDVRNLIPNEKNEIIDYMFLWKFNSLDSIVQREKKSWPNWQLTPTEKRKYYVE